MSAECFMITGAAFALGWCVRDYRQFMTPAHPLLDEMDLACAGIKEKRKFIGEGPDILHEQVWETRHGSFVVVIREKKEVLSNG